MEDSCHNWPKYDMAEVFTICFAIALELEEIFFWNTSCIGVYGPDYGTQLKPCMA